MGRSLNSQKMYVWMDDADDDGDDDNAAADNDDVLALMFTIRSKVLWKQMKTCTDLTN